MKAGRKRHTKVVFLPDWSRNNPYQRLLKDALAARGLDVALGYFPDGYFALSQFVRSRSDVDVIHLHWVNDLIAPIYWSDGAFKRNLKRIALMLDIWFLRLRGVAVVWTIHNLLAHESRDVESEIKVRRSLAMACSSVILHSQGALKRVEETYGIRLSRKASLVPHGNYAGCYPEIAERTSSLRERCRIDPDTLVILFFGAIRPYKGVSRLLDALRNVQRTDLRIIIAGKPVSDALADDIRSRAVEDSRVSLILEHVPSEDVYSLFELADIVAIPFENTLTSGSVILSLTMGRPLLLPEDARVLDAVNDDCAVFYDTPEALERALCSLDKQSLACMRTEAVRLASERRWDEVARRTEAVYRGEIADA